MTANEEVVEVFLAELPQLYHAMDPAPFHEKELNRDAEDYILSSVRQLSKNAPLELIVHLRRPAGLPDECSVLRGAIRAHFARRAQASRRQLGQLLRHSRISLAIGLPCLALSLIAGERMAALVGQGSLATVLRESFVIGGWAAMWRPLENVLYGWWPLVGERRIYDRLSRIAVRIIYAGTDQPKHIDEPLSESTQAA
jgi:hypothetical protein